jgi:hypothetical protein
MISKIGIALCCLGAALVIWLGNQEQERTNALLFFNLAGVLFVAGCQIVLIKATLAANARLADRVSQEGVAEEGKFDLIITNPPW